MKSLKGPRYKPEKDEWWGRGETKEVRAPGEEVSNVMEIMDFCAEIHFMRGMNLQNINKRAEVNRIVADTVFATLDDDWVIVQGSNVICKGKDTDPVSAKDRLIALQKTAGFNDICYLFRK
ncbi:hypothetical protein GF354_04710 [Candidatus Peregrinibacteria bacterium]|nr:hypothetical protein [Candidatus Peregrinibacteria bacterium]